MSENTRLSIQNIIHERTLLLLIVLGLFSSMILSHRLWFITRDFPTVPLIPGSDLGILNGLLFSVICISLFIVVWKINYRKWLIFTFVSMMLFMLLDLNRLQPWFYIYAFLLLAFSENIDKQKLLQWITIILAFNYMWSGIQKFNANFLLYGFPELIDTVLPFDIITSRVFAGVAAVTELIAALFLFRKKTRVAGIIFLIGMHLSILFIIGPLGNNINSVVWPWNIIFIAILTWLWLNNDASREMEFKLPLSISNSMIILFLGILPALSFFSLWPKYLSSALYSSNKIRSELFLSDAMKAKLPQIVQEAVTDSTNVLSMFDYSMSYLNVPDNPVPLIHQSIFEQLCEDTENEFDLIMELESTPDILTAERRKQTFFCDD